MANNTGEWSEIYTLFKLLGDRVLHLGDANLRKLHNVFYPILKILRTEKNGNFEYSVEDELVIISGQNEPLRVPVSRFREMAELLLLKIKTTKEGTFSVPVIEEFMQNVNCFSVKAKSSAKTDITIVVHDPRTGQQPTLGFSIKSQLGRASTLLNASVPTNLIFRVEEPPNLTTEQLETINSIKGHGNIQKRVQAALGENGVLKFVGYERSNFENNLTLIDTSLPELVAELVIMYYSGIESNIKSAAELLQLKNPLGFDTSNNHQFYSYKIKKLLMEVALGMMPAKKWDGIYDSTGGYLVVKEDGEVLCYHIYNKNNFEDYLFNNTKLDTGSTTKHKFGRLYRENGELYIKLNFQIRFLK